MSEFNCWIAAGLVLALVAWCVAVHKVLLVLERRWKHE